MALWNFIKSRLSELNRGEPYLVDQCGIPQNTVDRIRAGGVIRDSTKQKLALALGCSIGDINAAIAQPDPVEPKGHDMDLLARENRGPSVMETVDRLDQLVKEQYPEETEPDAKEGADMKWFQDVPKETPASSVPVKKEVLEDLFPAAEEPEAGPTEAEDVMDKTANMVYAAARSAVDVYKRKLKEICLQKMVEFRLGEDRAEDLYSDIGKALLDELMKEEAV
ncbi:MAG: hypothetical protein IKZ43_07470 [Acidaminococcaceae bacterium]|nr:hypothetical protein [Acidaminococcaceae bacterium]